MIPALAMVLALSTQPHAASAPQAAPTMLASSDGRLKNPKKFYEVLQRVQDDAEYAPPVGRQPDPEVTPTSPVRYHTAEELTLPVIVKPAPKYVTADAPKPDPNAPKTDATTAAPAATSFTAATPPTQATTDVLTPNQQATSPANAYQSAAQAASTESLSIPPAGSPTGSTATVKYN